MSIGYLPTGHVVGGRYEIQREIGRGGNSVVYAAHDRRVGATVAVKLLVPPPLVAHIARERMRREVLAVRGLSHQNIVAVHDLVEEDGSSLVVMEYVDGPDLQGRVRSRGSLGTDEAARLGEEIAAALAAAHARGILHRDVKPQNILLAADGRARLTDFGSARLEGQATVTQTGSFVGTAGYTAPEVMAGERGDARSDVFALGMTLYFALLGRLPAGGTRSAPPPSGFHPRAARPDVPEWLDAVVARSTSAKPGARFPTAAGVAEALRSHARGDWLVAEADAATDFCLVCGSTELHGVGICPGCAPRAARGADTLIFAEMPSSPLEREEAIRALSAMFAGAPARLVGRLARGERAIARVPRADAAGVVEQLARRRLPSRAVPAARAWSAIPMPYYGMLVLMLGVGMAAGIIAIPRMVWFSPLMTWLLLLLGLRAVTTPALGATRRPSSLPPELRERVEATLAELPPGTARSLLFDLTRLGETLFGHPPSGSSGEPRPEMESVRGVLESACGAALDLARLDQSLSVLDGQREQYATPSEKWLDAVARSEGMRDRLVQRLLDATSALGRARAQLAGGDDGAAAQLTELARELELLVAHRTEAAQEVEELLGGAPR